MLIDTHCHVNFSAYKDDYEQVIQNSLNENIWLINIGSQLSTSIRAVEIASKYQPGVYAAVGLHPIHLNEMEVDEFEQDIHFKSRAEQFNIDEYKKLLNQPQTVGIGEMGLDYFHLPSDKKPEEVKEQQKEVFIRGIRLAQEYNKPIIIHTRPSKGTFDAYDDVMIILDQVGYYNGVVHCYGGSLQQAQQFIERGLLISFTGIVTFKNARDLHQIVKALPLEKIMVETDAPYLSPEPFRGQRNEPKYVKYVAEKIAELKGVSYNQVAEVTTNTARNLFKI